MNHDLKLTTLLALCLTFSALTGIRAQETNPAVSLASTQLDLDRLAPGQTNGEAVFNIDRADNVVIDIAATVGGLETRIIGPAGQEITPSNAEAFGGSFTTFQGGAQESSPLILNSTSAGFHYVFIFPWMGTGNYTARFQAPSNLAEEAAVLTQVTTDSKVGVALIATEPMLVNGNPAVLTAAIFEGATPVAGASVSVSVQAGSGQPVNLTLRDDGAAGDGAAGDGLYSGEFTPTANGNYEAVARISGVAASGTSFARQAATRFVVIPPKSRLTGTVQDQGVDENNDGFLDKVALDIETNTVAAGAYRAFVSLKTAGGQTLIRSGDASLPAGMQNVRVEFEADALRQLGENGPYDIELVELLFLDTTSATPSDRLTRVGKTKPYQLSQFARPAIFLTGGLTDAGVDSNGNGLFDRLRVSVQINVLTGGAYSWSVKLTDQNLSEIDFAVGSGNLVAGVNNIVFEFTGSKIGASGANGPYLLRDLLVFGPSASLLAADAGQTRAFRNIQFEGFTRPLKEADLSLTQAASPNPVVPGSNVTFTIPVTNNGPDDATPVTVTSVLPPAVTFVSCAATGGGVCGGTGNNRTVAFASIASKATETVTLVAAVGSSVSDDTVIVASASATSGTSDPVALNNTASAEVSLVARSVQFNAFSSSVSEGAGSVTVVVTRSGSLSGAASVDYSTSNGTAVETSDYTASFGTLRFADGESEKRITVLVTDDVLEEGAETIQLSLTNANGAGLGAPGILTLSISDNDATPSPLNPLGDARFYVRQHYHDFLNREPDAAGLDFWASQIERCQQETSADSKARCLARSRVLVSAAFFLSIEYQQTGHVVFCFYKASFPDAASRPRGFPRLKEFLRDAQEIGQGVVVGQSNWEERLESNKQEFALRWVQRAEFLTLYPENMTAEAYVTALYANAGVTPTQAERDAALAAFGAGGVEGRARALRTIVESHSVCARQFNASFVLMQYFGYLRRDPNASPDNGFGGYDFWLGKLDSFSLPGEDVENPQVALDRITRAEIITAFLVSLEYTKRFGPTNFSIDK